MATALVALDSARTYLNDVNSQIWTDAVLLPYLKEAHRNLMLVLWLNGIPVIKERTTTLSNVPVNTTVIGFSTVPALPADLIEPIELKERAYGSSEQWIPMEERSWESDAVVQDASLNAWTWRKEALNFLGATSARAILLKYWKSLAILTSSGDALGFLFAEAFLGPQTAGYAANAVGNETLAKELLWIRNVNAGIAGSSLDMIIKANIKGMQNLPARRIGYRRSVRPRIYF